MPATSRPSRRRFNRATPYWVGLRDSYPDLSKLALDVLSIPASSCECKDLFSELGDMLEPRRQGLSLELLAGIQCARCWMKAGFRDSDGEAEAAMTEAQLEHAYNLSMWAGHYK
jgi:hypothetical protein